MLYPEIQFVDVHIFCHSCLVCCLCTLRNIWSMRASCESMIVQKSVGNFMHPVSSEVTFPSLISNKCFENVSADGSWSIWTPIFTFSCTFSILRFSDDVFKHALISSAYVECGITGSVCLKSPERSNRVPLNNFSTILYKQPNNYNNNPRFNHPLKVEFYKFSFI